MRLTVAAAAVAACLSAPALAQQLCLPRPVMLATLQRDYAEVPIAIGRTGQTVLELLVAPDGETWTLLQTMPNGMSCMAASGSDWAQITPVPVETPEDDRGAPLGFEER